MGLQQSAGPDRRRLGRIGWILFDWAQQPFNALVTGFVFGPWFVTGFIGEPVSGQTLYAWATAAAGALIALFSPVIGAVIDSRANPKAVLLALLLPFVLGSCGLWLAAPGAQHLAGLIVVCLVVAIVATELSFVAVNAMLPHLAEPGRVGRLSGSAWALGYAAALASLAIYLVGFAWPDDPLFGLDKEQGEQNRIVGAFAALWYVTFILPLFLLTPSPPRTGHSKPMLAGFMETLRHLRRDRGMAIFLAGRMLLGDGVNAAGTFGPVVAAALFGWSGTETGVFGVILATVAGVSTLIGGRLDDRLGSKRTILIFTAILILGVGGIGFVGSETLFFFIPVEPASPDALFGSTAERVFLAFGVLIGMGFGPAQASLRSWMARLSAPGEEGRWFGLFSLAGRATSFLAPMAIAAMTTLLGDVRAAVPVVLAFLLAGTVLLLAAPATRSEPPE